MVPASQVWVENVQPPAVTVPATIPLALTDGVECAQSEISILGSYNVFHRLPSLNSSFIIG